MKKSIISKFSVAFFAFTLLLAYSSSAFGGATIVVINNDGKNEGFNDKTRVAPVGDNPYRTLGEQRLYAFQFAADKWGATLDSNQTIYVLAQFNPLGAN